MTYADECLERAGKATEGPWGYNGKFTVSIECPEGLTAFRVDPHDAEFIAHAREDVPELARRLKKACEILFAIKSSASFGPLTLSKEFSEYISNQHEELEEPID